MRILEIKDLFSKTEKVWKITLSQETVLVDCCLPVTPVCVCLFVCVYVCVCMCVCMCVYVCVFEKDPNTFP